MRKDGSRFYASVVMDAIRNDAGELIGFAKLTRDITAQHEAQIALEQTREQLAQAQKMEALGQLTGGIAHDFNNLLMIVSGYAQILQRRLSEPKDMQAVEAIRAAANRGERLTRQLLTFSRRQQLMPVVVDLRQRIDAVRDMLAPSLRGNIELICDIEDKIWPVEVDLGELELALVNIAVNARDAMPDGGTITLSARNVVLKPGSAAGALEGDFVALAIIDTGTGMPPDVLQRVFEPFFTTKPVGKGTGLGLSQVHGFANQSGGAVTVSSELGRGTVVTIYLPRSATPSGGGRRRGGGAERAAGAGHRAGGGGQPRRRRGDLLAARTARLPRGAGRKCRRGAAPSAAGHRSRSVVFRHRHAGRDQRPRPRANLPGAVSRHPGAAHQRLQRRRAGRRRPLRHPAQAVRTVRAGARDRSRRE